MREVATSTDKTWRHAISKQPTPSIRSSYEHWQNMTTRNIEATDTKHQKLLRALTKHHDTQYLSNRHQASEVPTSTDKTWRHAILKQPTPSIRSSYEHWQNITTRNISATDTKHQKFLRALTKHHDTQYLSNRHQASEVHTSTDKTSRHAISQQPTPSIRSCYEHWQNITTRNISATDTKHQKFLRTLTKHHDTQYLSNRHQASEVPTSTDKTWRHAISKQPTPSIRSSYEHWQNITTRNISATDTKHQKLLRALTKHHDTQYLSNRHQASEVPTSTDKTSRHTISQQPTPSIRSS